MVRDAESHADEDKRLRRVADARNAAEARVHEAERQLKDNGDKVDETVRRDLEGAIDAAKSAAAGEDADDIEAKTAGLTDVLHRLSEQVYQKAAAQQDTAAGNGAASDDTVEDAEYEVIDEDAPKAS